MRITLNLASRPFADLGQVIKRLRVGMGVLAVLAISLGFGLLAFDRKAEEARARDHSLDGQIARITQERQGYQSLMAQPANAQLLIQVGTLNRLFDEKAFSWTLAMEDLETLLPGGVQVSTLEPVRAKDGHITLHLRVIGPRDRAVELVRNLEHSKRFLLPRIVGENAESNGGPAERLEPVSASNRVDFDMLAEYNPASSVEHKDSKKPAAASEGSANTPMLKAVQPHASLTPIRKVPMSQGAAPDASRGPGRPPYTGSQPPKPSPSLRPAPGGPQ
jgi:type IV pilus assembly protein PilN